MNVLALLGATWFVWRTLRLFEPSPAWQLAGTLGFVWSFPFYYYGTTGLVDPPALCLVAAGLFFVLTERWWAFVAVGLLGGLAKESVVLLAPVALAQCAPRAVSRPGRSRRWRSSRWRSPRPRRLGRALSPARGDYAFWMGLMLWENLARGRVYLAFALSFGLQGVFALAAVPALRPDAAVERRRYLPLVVGALGSLALFGYAVVAARPDGRFVWLGHPFLTPLAVLGAAGRRWRTARAATASRPARRSPRTAGPSPRY